MSYYGMRWWYYSPIFWELWLVDRVTKMTASALLVKKPFVVTPFLSFEYSLNVGLSWNLLSYLGYWAYTVITPAMFVVLLVLAKYTIDRQKKGYEVMGETLILAGGFGNLVDRLSYSGVVDFIKVTIGQWVFPIFNVADIAITIGACIILYQFCFGTDE